MVKMGDGKSEEKSFFRNKCLNQKKKINRKKRDKKSINKLVSDLV